MPRPAASRARVNLNSHEPCNGVVRLKSADYRWYVLGVSTLTQLTAALASQGIGVWGTFAQKTFGLSLGQIGGLATFSNVVPILGLALVGRVLDQYGERWPVVLGLAILSVAMTLVALSSGYAGLVAGMLMIGVGYSPVQPGGSRAIYHWFPPGERGLAMGVRQAALPLGGALAAVFFPALLIHTDWTRAMLGASIVLAASAIVYGAVFRNSPRHAQRASASALDGLKHHLRDAGFRRISVVGAVLVGAQTAISIFWAIFAQRRFGYSPTDAAWVLFIVQLSGSAGRIVLSAISDRIADGKRRFVTLCLGITPVALVAAASLPAHSATWVVVTFSALVGVCCFGWYGPWVVWLSDSAEDGQVGEVLGAAMAINQIAIASVPAIFGFVSDIVSAPALPWYCISGLLGLAFAWTLRASSKERGASPAGGGTDRRDARKYQPLR